MGKTIPKPNLNLDIKEYKKQLIQYGNKWFNKIPLPSIDK